MSTQLKTPASDEWIPSMEDMPFHRLGGEEGVMALAHAFYDAMDASEPALARLHPLDAAGKVDPGIRQRFGLFLIGWLGGPQHYIERHGHPRLRMRHGQVPVDTNMRDAWLRCMHQAMEARGVTGGVRRFLEERFSHTADFLRNTEG